VRRLAFTSALLLAAMTLAVDTSPAEAGTRVYVGVGLGFAPWPYYHYPPPYYYPPPIYYPPPVVYYAPPPPIYYTPLPPPATATPARCRIFSGDATNDQSGQPFFGRACLWADGRWHIIN